MSDFNDWEQKLHANDYLLFPENCGVRLAIDETSLTYDELYTIITNKDAKGKKGSIVAIIKGVKSDYIIEILKKLPKQIRHKVTEITLDMANSMKLIAKKSFPKAEQVTDRFHVQKLANEALQEIRIKYRWKAIDKENNLIKETKEKGEKYKPNLYKNGDSPKQLLARSRYLLYKSRDKWTKNQKIRAKILFEYFPEIEKAYKLAHHLRYIFNQNYHISIARTKLALWFNKVEQAGFNILANTIELNHDTILNYFNNRSTNASAESFNAKIKAFRAQFRGVRDVKFFLYRLTKIYA